MILTELLYLTRPRSPQNPVSVEYSRLDTYVQSACSVCVKCQILFLMQFCDSILDCKQLVDVKLKLGSVLWLFCTYMPRLFANGI
ncbi:hypothetical protein ACQJBY_001854 [Aegilops geniculata]